MTVPQDPPHGPPQGPPQGSDPGYFGAPPSGPSGPSGYAVSAPGAYPSTPYGSGYPAGPQLASWGQRVGAYLIDWALVVGIIVVGLIVSAIFNNVSSALGALIMVIFYLGAIGFAFWQLAVQGSTGQTIGKGLVGIKVLRQADGAYIGAGMSILRYFAHIIDAIPCYIGYLWPLWDEYKQTFADKICSTLVVRA